MVSGNKIGAFSCSKNRVVFILLCLYGVNQNFYYYWLIDRLIDWQVDWLIDLMTVLILEPRLKLNLPYSSTWPQYCGSLPASASWVFGLQAWDTMLTSYVSVSKVLLEHSQANSFTFSHWLFLQYISRD